VQPIGDRFEPGVTRLGCRRRLAADSLTATALALTGALAGAEPFAGAGGLREATRASGEP